VSYTITINSPAVSAATAETVTRDQQAEQLKGIVKDGQRRGCTTRCSPRTLTALVVDEWPDEATFQRFFEIQREISKLTEAMGGSPDAAVESTTHRILDTPRPVWRGSSDRIRIGWARQPRRADRESPGIQQRPWLTTPALFGRRQTTC
jgi:hypothetical protein